MPRMAANLRLARRRQFLDAARRCVANKGYSGFTIDDVCEEAQLSKGSFYSHFKQKRDLLIALFEDEAREVEDLIRVLSRDDIAHSERAHEFLKVAINRATETSEVQMRADLWSQMFVDADLRQRVTATLRRRRRLLAEWIEAAVNSGEMVDIPANALAAILLALADGLMLHRVLDPAGFQWSNVRRALDVMFECLGQT